MKNLARVLVSLLLFVFLTISLPVVDSFGVSDGVAMAAAVAIGKDMPTGVSGDSGKGGSDDSGKGNNNNKTYDDGNSDKGSSPVIRPSDGNSDRGNSDNNNE